MKGVPISYRPFRALEDFQAEDQETVIKLIDAMIVKRNVERAINPFHKQEIKAAEFR